MESLVRIDHIQALAWAVSLTLRVPASVEQWAMDQVVLVDGRGYRCKSVMGDGDAKLVSLVRWSAADEEA